MTDAGVRAFEMVAALDYERTAGSPQEAQAARSIVSVLHSIGLSPHTQTFEIPLYQITRASFSVTSPASNALFFGVIIFLIFYSLSILRTASNASSGENPAEISRRVTFAFAFSR